MTKLINKIKNYVFAYRMKMYKRKADKLRERTGKQHFIVILYGRITIVNKTWLKGNRRKGVMPANFNIIQLKKHSYYAT